MEVLFRGCQLPPGFRFQPTDQEIIVYYLKKKIAVTATAVTSIIADVDIYKFDPWDLPDKAIFGEGEWFFFSPRDRKYPNGVRPNRTAGSGYWKATGTDKPILAPGGAHCLGVKKALVFYQGRSPKGTKTQWVMHEYRLLHTDNRRPADSMRLDDWVLCRVRNKGISSSFAGPDMDDERQPTTTLSTTTRAAALPPPVPPAADIREISAGFRDIDWNSDGQLLHYLIGGGGSPPDPSAGASSASVAGHHGDSTPPQALVSVLESIKSFQAIDELYLLHGQPSKRANCMVRGDDDHHHHMSPTSFSISEADEVF